MMAPLVSTANGEDADDASDPNRIVQCPYDKNHQIRASRFPFHVLKCRKVGYGRGNLFHVLIFHLIFTEIVKTQCTWHWCNENFICPPPSASEPPQTGRWTEDLPLQCQALDSQARVVSSHCKLWRQEDTKCWRWLVSHICTWAVTVIISLYFHVEKVLLFGWKL